MMMKFYCVVNVFNAIIVMITAEILFVGRTTTNTTITADAFQYYPSTTTTIIRKQSKNNFLLLHPNTKFRSILPTTGRCFQQYKNKNKNNKPSNGHLCIHQQVLLSSSSLSFQLFATSDVVPDEDDDDDSSSSSKYALNRQQNCQWLIKRFKFPKKKLDQHQRYYSFLTLDNSMLEERADGFQDKLDLTDNEMNKIIITFPRILELKDDSIDPTLHWLEQRLNLKDSQVSKIVQDFPQIIKLSVHDNIEPTFQWLQQRLNLKDSQVGKIVQKSPSIIGLSVHDNIEPKFQWLQQRLNLTDSQVGKMVYRFPQIANLSIHENIDPTLHWLEQRLSPTESQLSRLVLTYPSILGMSIKKNVAPKIDFFLEAANDNIIDEAIIDMLCSDARLFTSSLEKRLIPRLAEAKEANMTIDRKCLRKMARDTDEDWSNYLE